MKVTNAIKDDCTQKIRFSSNIEKFFSLHNSFGQIKTCNEQGQSVIRRELRRETANHKNKANKKYQQPNKQIYKENDGHTKKNKVCDTTTERPLRLHLTD